MYPRDLGPFLKEIHLKYPVLTLIGPRQSGKSTLVKNLFPDYSYVSLETPTDRLLAQQDSDGFFKKYPDCTIIDEVQRVPDLLSSIQTRVDTKKVRYILTGSQQLLLMEKVSQSLAGRTFIAKLLPFSKKEIIAGHHTKYSLDESLFYGGYPRIYDQNLSPTQWLEQYFETYVERDVRNLANITQLDVFRRFVKLCAGRVGQLINLSSLGNDSGLTHPTVQAWLNLLEISFVIFRLPPHFRNFNKRLVKSPKLYFYDTGLLCYLLNIRSPEMLENHPLRGHIFENAVILELMKQFYNLGQTPSFYFWRDAKGHEVDLILETSLRLYPLEIKSSCTFQPDFLKNLLFFNDLQKSRQEVQGHVIYAGDSSLSFRNYSILGWRDLDQTSFTEIS